MTAELARAVTEFCAVVAPLSEADLNRPWGWRAYTGEGVRFACFRVLEELRTLAVAIGAARVREGAPATQAQRILHRHQIAFRELEGLLLLVSDDLGGWPPAAGEWPLQTVLGHITDAEASFFAVIIDSLRRYRAGAPGPVPFDEGTMRAFYGEEMARYEAVTQAPLSAVRALLREVHARVLAELSGMTDAELEVTSIWWEGEPMPARFRLHRFESHMRQHMIQAEKTLEAVAGPPTEARRLARMLLAALADVEGTALGAPDTDRMSGTAAGIRDITAGIRRALLG